MHPALATLPAWCAPYMGRGKPGYGVIYDLPEDQYHGSKALISKSALDVFAESPFHYLASLDKELEPRDLPQFRIGGAYHVGVLEPDLFHAKVIKMPEFGPMQSGTNRRLRDEWIKHEAAGKIYLYPSEWAQVIAMRDVLLKSRLAKKLFRPGGRSEVTAIWTDPETGLRCKARGDHVNPDFGMFLDLKSALTASPEGFRRNAAACRYMVQDSFYSRAFEENDIQITDFVFLVQEKDYPYAYAAYQYNDSARLRGEELYMRELRYLRACIDRDYFPSYSPEDAVMAIDLPAHAAKDWEVGA